MFLYVIETLVIVTVIVVAVHQVIIPWWSDKPAFPIFRKKGELEKTLGNLKEEVEVTDLEREVDVLRNKTSHKEKDKDDNRNRIFD